MTEEYRQHPITPPPELVQQWIEGDEGGPGVIHRIATRAAQWGADQELDACCEWFSEQGYGISVHKDLYTARRPKPPSLAEEALEAARLELYPGHKNGALIIKALERLQELENNQ